MAPYTPEGPQHSMGHPTKTLMYLYPWLSWVLATGCLPSDTQQHFILISMGHLHAQAWLP